MSPFLRNVFGPLGATELQENAQLKAAIGGQGGEASRHR